VDKDNNHRFKILIVDDVPKNIQVAANILQKEGYQMAFAPNGKTALAQTRKIRFDLILLDIMMPEMDGYEVCRQIRQNSKNKEVPIIFLSAKNDSESIIQGFEMGAMDYVAKPFNGAELSARVKTHLELFRSRKELKQTNDRLQIEINERIKVEEELKCSREEYYQLSIHDNLTGLYNTRYLYKKLEELTHTSALENKPYSLIFMDVDNFKSVVDTHGHLNGSQALAEVAKTILLTIRPPCFGVAYGGDEFVTVLPDFTKKEALRKAEEIRTRMIETIYLPGVGNGVSLRASFGVATYPDDAENIAHILASADQAMFHIKTTGKNAVGDLALVSV
jgi:diguanylate cyclase (GGDEF)-like protein